MADWDEITADPTYRALPQQARDQIRLNFYHAEIEPNVPDDKRDAVRQNFFKSTSEAENADYKQTSYDQAIGNAAGRKTGFALQGLASGLTAGLAQKDASLGPPQTAGEKASNFAGEGMALALPEGAPFTVASHIMAPVAERAAARFAPGLAARAAGAIPEAVMSRLPTGALERAAGAGVKNAVDMAAYAPVQTEGETRGQASPAQLAGSSVIGAAGGMAMGGGIGLGMEAAQPMVGGAAKAAGGAFDFIRQKFPDLFKGVGELPDVSVPADKAQGSSFEYNETPQPDPTVRSIQQAYNQKRLMADAGLPSQPVLTTPEKAVLQQSGSVPLSMDMVHGNARPAIPPALVGEASGPGNVQPGRVPGDQGPQQMTNPMPQGVPPQAAAPQPPAQTGAPAAPLPGAPAPDGSAPARIESSDPALTPQQMAARQQQLGTDKITPKAPGEPPLLAIDPDRAGNINAAQFDLADRPKALLQDISERYDKTLNRQARGTRAWDESAEAARNVGISEKDLSLLKQGKVLNAEQLYSAAQWVKLKSEQLASMEEKIMGGDDSTKALLDYQQARNELLAVQHGFSGASAEAGRSLNILKAIKGARQSPDARFSEGILEALGGRKLTVEQARTLAALGDNPRARYDFLNALQKPTMPEYAMASFINGILSSPTSIVKVGAAQAGNTALDAFVIRPLRAAVGLIPGVEQKVLPGEIMPGISGWLNGWSIGARKGWEMLRHGVSTDDIASLAMGSREVGPWWNEMGTRFHKAFMSMNGAIAGQSELYASAAREAIKAGGTAAEQDALMKELIANPTETMQQTIRERIGMATATTPLGEGGYSSSLMKEAQHLINWKVPGTKLRPFRFIQPFTVIPTNIFSQATSNSPLGFLKAGLTAGGLRNGRVDEELARGAFGTLVMAPFAALLMEGKMWGAAPKNPAQREQFFATHPFEYGIQIGDKAMAYDKVEHIAAPLKAMADWHDEWRRTDKLPNDKRVLEAGKVMGAGTLNTAGTLGPFEILDAVRDPNRAGVNVVQRLAQGAVPYSGALRAATRLQDPTLRSVSNAKEAVQSIIPGQSQQLPARTDALGQPIVRESGIVQPIRYADMKSDPNMAALEKAGVKLERPNASIGGRTIDKQTLNAYNTERGGAIKAALDQARFSGMEASPATKQFWGDKVKQAEAPVREKYEAIAELKALGLRADPAIAQQFGPIMRTPFYKQQPDSERKAYLMSIMGAR